MPPQQAPNDGTCRSKPSRGRWLLSAVVYTGQVAYSHAAVPPALPDGEMPARARKRTTRRGGRPRAGSLLQHFVRRLIAAATARFLQHPPGTRTRTPPGRRAARRPSRGHLSVWPATQPSIRTRTGHPSLADLSARVNRPLCKLATGARLHMISRQVPRACAASPGILSARARSFTGSRRPGGFSGRFTSAAG